MAENRQVNILVVDDNAYNLEVLSRRLERRGFSTICVDSGAKALETLSKHPVDLVLLDIMMPGMDGMEVLTRARKTFSKGDLPIIMVTSRGDSEDVVEALSRGANDYVMKPIDFPVTLARIKSQLAHKQEFSSQMEKLRYTLEPGDRFGHYAIVQKIGQGGMGAVYKAHDPSLDRVVALKVVLPGHELTTPQAERFTREAKAIAKIKHPNIVAVYEIGQQPRHYFTMDFIEGRNLSRLIKEEGMDWQTAARIAAKVASALEAAHDKGIIHRDLKPSNIMVSEDWEPHLMDFGLAKLDNEEEQITRTGDILGTPEYMAPEQVDPAFGETDFRSDIYSLGIILYEMLTGLTPFNGSAIRVLWQKLNQDPRPPSQVSPEIPRELETICMTAMARPKNSRYQKACDMSAAMDPLIETLDA